MADQQWRINKLIEPRLQMKSVVLFLAMAGLAAFMQSIVLRYNLNKMALSLPHDGAVLNMYSTRMIQDAFFLTFLGLAPLIGAIGVVTTHRIVGPVHAMRRYLEKLKAGTATEPCKVRADDELQELCILLNEATAPLRSPNGEGEGS